MARTTTGSFPIGFRRGWSDWQKDLAGVMQFAKANGFEGIDVGPLDVAEIKKIVAAGLKVGTVDAKDWSALGSSDAGKRKAAAQVNADYMKAVIAAGCRNFFFVLLPEDAARPRQENFGFFADGLGQLCAAVKGSGAHLAIEGWPGGAPHFAALACTPADYRAILKAVDSEVMGINFDPSHLIRVGIDPVRFLNEFAPRVAHVHGKDTEILDDELQEHGILQRATFAKGHGFGENYWRYTIPGHGCARWGKLFSILRDAAYKGMVSIELEDENFNTSDAGEKKGLLASRDFLASV